MQNTIKHVMILGCGRSGTSIFGELFEHLEPYSYTSEPLFSEMLTYDFNHPIAIKVPKESKDYPPTTGLSFPLDALDKLTSTPIQIYWQVRHPLDAICSLRIGIANNWGHHPKPPDWQAWLERPLIERCAHHWAYINTVGFQQVQDIAKVKTFEAMLKNPLAFANTISEELGLDARAYQGALQGWAMRVQNTNNEHFVEAMTSRAYSREDHSVRVERWRENLSKAEVEAVLPIISDAAMMFGYDFPNL